MACVCGHQYLWFTHGHIFTSSHTLLRCAVLYEEHLPSFDDEHGPVLGQRDSELLISYLTVPYLRIPLVLSFFASHDRVHKLASAKYVCCSTYMWRWFHSI